MCLTHYIQILYSKRISLYCIFNGLIYLNMVYRVNHNLWQFPGNSLQIANYDRYSDFGAIFGMLCLFTSRKVQKVTHSAQKKVFKLLFFKATKKTTGADFFWRPMK